MFLFTYIHPNVFGIRVALISTTVASDGESAASERVNASLKRWLESNSHTMTGKCKHS